MGAASARRPGQLVAIGVVTVLLMLGASRDASAERYALLVGVSHYAASGATADLNLEGPIEDVPALERVLITRFGFADRNIVTLIDNAATRQAIIDRLAAIIGRMTDADYLLFYFSGHGTSAFDQKMRQVAAFIGPNSGALAPHDLRIDSAEHAAESLIIGRRDLRPLFERLPKGSLALVVLDACYSENSVRSIPQRLTGKTRGITLAGLVPPPSGSPGASGAPDPGASAMSLKDEAYPYPNVVALTAASKDEQAVDIDARGMVDGRYPTIDGKAHGAFTNSLLEGMGGGGDRNGDGTLSVQELYDFTRQAVQRRFAQTPQLLAPASHTITQAAAFAVADPGKVPACEATVAKASGRVRVQLENAPASLRPLLAQSPEIQVVDSSADLVVRQGPGVLELYDAAGALIQQFSEQRAPQLVARARAEAAIRELLGFRVPCQAFNASLRLRPEGRSRFSPEDRIEIAAVLDAPAYLLLLDVDTSGAVSVVYPAAPGERRQQPASVIVPLGITKPVAPFGSEHLKLIGFRAAPSLERLGCRPRADGGVNCRTIAPSSVEFAALMQLLTDSGRSISESSLRFVTYQN